jgi:hypothetical protein
VLGVRADVLITPKLYLREKLDLFYLAVGEFSGGILDQGLGLEYRFWKYAGVGVDFEGFRFGLQSKGGGSVLLPKDAKITVDYTGLLFYARFYY